MEYIAQQYYLSLSFWFCQEVFEFIDVNHDGTIEFEEFLHVSNLSLRLHVNKFLILLMLFYWEENHHADFEYSVYCSGSWPPDDQFKQGGNQRVYGGNPWVKASNNVIFLKLPDVCQLWRRTTLLHCFAKICEQTT